MDTRKMDRWWYALPEEIRKRLYVQEGTDVWNDLDMPARAALFRYCRMKIFGIGKNGDMERSLLIEAVCGLADIALVKGNGLPLEDMCDDEGEFLEEYQEQFNTVYDRYEVVLADMDWPAACTGMEPAVSEIIGWLEKAGYSRVDIDTDSRAAKTFYTYRGGLHINGTEDLSFHIVPSPDIPVLGRFAICATRNGESSQLGTDHAPLFFRRLSAFIRGERKENEIIDEVCTDRKNG
ncbi:hypothetical protein [Paraprevotella clara]|uniref:hypothetical protein n=1 Tax=Paraprevotella clara TaxID=454154 RepID=UPI003AB515A6